MNLSFQSNPTGLQLTTGVTTAKALFTLTAIGNQPLQLTDSSEAEALGETYAFVSWSDGGAQSHVIRARRRPPPT
ncbi:MAG: hypothetical protein ACRDLC_14070, partial [Actinomycetota bacterium]